MVSCPICGSEVAVSGSPGRPSVYCSTACRRRAELPRRRHLRQVAAAERRVKRAEKLVEDLPNDWTRRDLIRAVDALTRIKAE